MKDMLKKEAGFTLLELIVVVAVIGILAAIVVPQISDIQGNAEVNSTKASLASIQTALEQYKLNDSSGQYPDDSGSGPSSWDSLLGVDGTGFTYSNAGTSQTDYVVYTTTNNTTYYINSNQSKIATSNSTTVSDLISTN